MMTPQAPAMRLGVMRPSPNMGQFIEMIVDSSTK